MKPAFFRRWNLLAFAFAGLLAGLWWFGTPRYEGRSLAYWFHEFHRTDQGRRQPRGRHVERAIQALGTNAVPYLLEQAFVEDAAVRLWILGNVHMPGLATAMPSWFKAYMGERLVERDLLADDAAIWIGRLHPPVQLVLPTLTNQLAGNGMRKERRAIRLLGCLDATALPYLQPLITNHAPHMRAEAFAALVELGTNATAEVPDLAALNDLFHEVPIRFWHEIGPPARAILPRLRLRWLSETNFEALVAIMQVGDEGWARDAFRQCLQERTNHALRFEAIHYVEEQWPPLTDGSFLRPELMRAAEDEAAKVRFHALAAIGRLRLDTTPLQPRLEAKLREPLPAKNNTDASWNEWHERLWAADLLLRMDPANPVAIAFLGDRLGDFEAWQAVDILARLENPGPPVLKLLERATRHRDPSVRELAREALAEFR